MRSGRQFFSKVHPFVDEADVLWNSHVHPWNALWKANLQLSPSFCVVPSLLSDGVVEWRSGQCNYVSSFCCNQKPELKGHEKREDWPEHCTVSSSADAQVLRANSMTKKWYQGVWPQFLVKPGLDFMKIQISAPAEVLPSLPSLEEL